MRATPARNPAREDGTGATQSVALPRASTAARDERPAAMAISVTQPEAL